MQEVLLTETEASCLAVLAEKKARSCDGVIEANLWRSLVDRLFAGFSQPCRFCHGDLVLRGSGLPCHLCAEGIHAMSSARLG